MKSYLLPPFLMHLGTLASADSKTVQKRSLDKVKWPKKAKTCHISDNGTHITLPSHPKVVAKMMRFFFEVDGGEGGAQGAAHSEKINSGQKGVLSLLYQFMLKKDASDKISREKGRSTKMIDLLRAPLICRIQ